MALNKNEIDKLLKGEIAYLATANSKASPHVKPIWYIYRKRKIWFMTDIPKKAYRNITENNKIMLCFGGRETYLVWGKVKEFKESNCPIPFRKLLWTKYKEEMEDSYITDKTRIFEVVIQKEKSWHYLAGET